MKTLLVVSLAFLSLNSFAEVCKSVDYEFDITKSTISFQDEDARSVKLKISLNKTLKAGSQFRSAVASMASDEVSDSPISKAEASAITKMTLQASAGNDDLVGMAYAKAFDKDGNIVARFIMSEGGYNRRCL